MNHALAPIRAALAESCREADLLETNGMNVVPIRRVVERIEQALAVVEVGTAFVSTLTYAKRLGISAETVRQRCEAGAIPGAIRQGRVWRIPNRAA